MTQKEKEDLNFVNFFLISDRYNQTRTFPFSFSERFSLLKFFVPSILFKNVCNFFKSRKFT